MKFEILVAAYHVSAAPAHSPASGIEISEEVVAVFILLWRIIIISSDAAAGGEASHA